MKAVVIFILLSIIGVLGSALVFLVRDRGQGHRTLNALRLRVALSIGLLAFIWFSHWMGWLAPRQY